MNRETILRKVRLKDEYEVLKRQIKAGRQTLEEDARISERMAAIRYELGILPGKRPTGRPRIHPVGAPRVRQLKGTPAQQREAVRLRERIAAAKAEVELCLRLFAKIGSTGGPKR